MQGGHTVPIDKILSRYTRSIANLTAAIRLADRVYIYDNSIEDVQARLVARTSSGTLRKVYVDLPKWVLQTVDSFPRHTDFVDQRAV